VNILSGKDPIGAFKGRWSHLLIYIAVGLLGIAVFLFVAFRLLHVSTNTAKVLLLKGPNGLHLTTKEPLSRAEEVVIRIDATPLFNTLFENIAGASTYSLVDSNYDPMEGKGIIKEFRPDGTRLEIALARYDEEGIHPHGLILGGEFPFGDSRGDENGSGLAIYDGTRWIHLWCTANEGIALAGGGQVYEPHRWRYVTGRILERSSRRVELASIHEVELENVPVKIIKRLRFEAGNNFLTLTTTVRNLAETDLLFDYAYGDEPWIGKFGNSEGDVGWFEEGLVTRERHIDGKMYSFIGYADIGNPDFGEKEAYTGYANYIQWVGTKPSEVYFSNDFFSVQGRILGSRDNRVLNLVWRNQPLRPGESQTFTLRIGFVPPGENLFQVGRRLSGRSGFRKG